MSSTTRSRCVRPDIYLYPLTTSPTGYVFESVAILVVVIMPRAKGCKRKATANGVSGILLADRTISRRNATFRQVSECKSCGSMPQSCNEMQITCIIPHRYNTWETYKIALPKPNTQWYNPNCGNKCINLWEVVGIAKAPGYMIETGSTHYNRWCVGNKPAPLRYTDVGGPAFTVNTSRIPDFTSEKFGWEHEFPDTSITDGMISNPRFGPNFMPYDWRSVAQGIQHFQFYDWKSEEWRQDEDLWCYGVSDINGNGQLTGLRVYDTATGAAANWPASITDLKGKQGVTAMGKSQCNSAEMFQRPGTCFEDPNFIYYTVLNSDGRPFVDKTSGRPNIPPVKATYDAGVAHFEEITFIVKLTKWCVEDLAERAIADWVERVNPNIIFPSADGALATYVQYPNKPSRKTLGIPRKRTREDETVDGREGEGYLANNHGKHRREGEAERAARDSGDRPEGEAERTARDSDEGEDETEPGGGEKFSGRSLGREGEACLCCDREIICREGEAGRADRELSSGGKHSGRSLCREGEAGEADREILICREGEAGRTDRELFPRGSLEGDDRKISSGLKRQEEPFLVG